MKKRFMAGKIGLVDLISSPEAKDISHHLITDKVVVYDESTTYPNTLTREDSVYLVIRALTNTPLLLRGGLSEFGINYPCLCEASAGPRVTSPGQRDQALHWAPPPPVSILSYFILGSARDAQCRCVLEELRVKYVLNVTTMCPNFHEEDERFIYKRIAVSDTDTDRLSPHFTEAFEFIELARKNGSCVFVHCSAGISRSATLTIAYIMSYYKLALQTAYQYVKERRPAISPNLNFMGQLVEFGQGEGEGKERCLTLRLEDYAA